MDNHAIRSKLNPPKWSRYYCPWRGIALVCLFAIALIDGTAAEMSGTSDPTVSSVFPSCGRQGTTVQAVIGGKFLDGSYALWFADKGLRGRILRTEEVREEVKGDATPVEKPKDPPRVYRTSVELQIDPAARLGDHSVQLVTPYGLSNAVTLNVI